MQFFGLRSLSLYKLYRRKLYLFFSVSWCANWVQRHAAVDVYDCQGVSLCGSLVLFSLHKVRRRQMKLFILISWCANWMQAQLAVLDFSEKSGYNLLKFTSQEG